MLSHINLQNVLFIDIETVPGVKKIDALSKDLQALFFKKVSRKIEGDVNIDEYYFNNSAIFAEFGKIICISAGIFLQPKNDKISFRIKSFFGDDEKKLLSEFIDLLNVHFNSTSKHVLCGHNAKEFDFPYLARRILVNELALPDILDIAGKKPWEIAHIDTMQLWKFGDFKNYTSLNLLAAIFNIPSPKIDIDGSDIANLYYLEKDMSTIVEYCQRDVLTVAQLLLKYKGMPLIQKDQVVISKVVEQYDSIK